MYWVTSANKCGHAIGLEACARPSTGCEPAACRIKVLAAEFLVGLATDTIVSLNRRGEALEAITLTFSIRASDSLRHPGLPGRPPFPREAVLWVRVRRLPYLGNRC